MLWVILQTLYVRCGLWLRHVGAFVAGASQGRGSQVRGVGLEQDAVQGDAEYVVGDVGFLERQHAPDAHVPFAISLHPFEHFCAGAEGVEVAPQVHPAAFFHDGEEVFGGVAQVDVDGQVPVAGELKLQLERLFLQGGGVG